MTCPVEDFNDFSYPSIDNPIDCSQSNIFSDLSINDRVAAHLFKIASYLSEPICRMHQKSCEIKVLSALYPNARKIEICAKKCFLSMGIAAWASVAFFTTFSGAALRFLASSLQKHPFIYFEGSAPEKQLEGNEFSLLSWNICCVSGGYSITEGGVMPWQHRIGSISEKVKERDADVVCLYEVFDNLAAFRLYEELKDEYPHFYFNIGPRTIGASSGILVASKYKMANPEFTAFPKSLLVGRTKHCEKGVFAFDLRSEGDSFARLYTTHLQHSEEPMYPTEEEVIARKEEMRLILEKMQEASGATILTGDLNLEDEEFEDSFWSENFVKAAPFERKTWGGDAFCAHLTGKQVSDPLNLDYTMFVRDTAQEIHTELVPTEYDPQRYHSNALSDHEGLYSTIRIH